VPRELRIEIAERLDADGRVLVPLDEAAVARAAQALSAVRIEAVAVGFLQAYRNDIHERRAGDILRRLMPDAARWTTAPSSAAAATRARQGPRGCSAACRVPPDGSSATPAGRAKRSWGQRCRVWYSRPARRCA
jgi:N-methylhydantoinase A